MTTAIDSYVGMAMQHGQEIFLHIGTLNILLRCLSIDRMVTDADDPVLMGSSQCRVDPCQFLVAVLLASIGISLRVVAVTVHEWCGVDEDDAHGAALTGEDLRIVTGRHVPATAHITVVEDCLCVATILVVTHDRVPETHELGVRINELVVGHPQGIGRALHTIEVMDVTHGDDCLRADGECHLTHELSDGLLVIVTIATHVVDPVEVDR